MELADLQLSIVQFPHPRGERRPDDGERYLWNTEAHGRKFMRATGRWTGGSKSGDTVESGDVVFWGEWEAPSLVIERYPKGDWQMPRYLSEPVWTRPSEGDFLQNTDPYVFGGPFRYSNCRQNTRKARPKSMQRLDIGSLILFGSLMDGSFVLDTAFVVGTCQPMSGNTVEEVKGMDDAFRAVVCDVLYRGDNIGHQNTLFSGATPQNRVGGMFSFFPCLPAEDAPVGFARPTIELGRSSFLSFLGALRERTLSCPRQTVTSAVD